MNAPLLDVFLSQAKARGFTDDETRELWSQHTRWCDDRNVSAGGGPWIHLLNACVERRNEEADSSKRLTQEAETRAAHRAAERRAKQVADAAYDREAITLGEYLDSLVAGKENPTIAELRLLETAPSPGEDVAAFLMRALCTKEGR